MFLKITSSLVPNLIWTFVLTHSELKKKKRRYNFLRSLWFRLIFKIMHSINMYILIISLSVIFYQSSFVIYLPVGTYTDKDNDVCIGFEERNFSRFTQLWYFSFTGSFCHAVIITTTVSPLICFVLSVTLSNFSASTTHFHIFH